MAKTMTTQESLAQATTNGHRFVVRGREAEAGEICQKCLKPLWTICKERHEGVERCKDKPDEPACEGYFDFTK